MNRLSKEKQRMILDLLVEGNSIRGIERITGVHRDTIIRLMKSVSESCRYAMWSKFQSLECRNIECDEIWTFVGKKQKRVTFQEQESGTGFGDQYVFVAIDRDTKLVPAFYVGKRNGQSTVEFMRLLKGRLNTGHQFQLTTDMYRPYANAVTWTFGTMLHFAMLRKVYYGDGTGREGYSPARLKMTESSVVTGNPNPDKISTSFVERQNLTMRTQLRRFTRLTNAFSKKLDCLKASLALHFWHYNFMRAHQSLRMTPAMAAGISESYSTWDEVLES